jgi:hypothetical protein
MHIWFDITIVYVPILYELLVLTHCEHLVCQSIARNYSLGSCVCHLHSCLPFIEKFVGYMDVHIHLIIAQY